MGIIAVLMLLSASTFVLLRNQAEVNQTAETIISTVRDAQNRSISITPDKNDNDAKVWAVSVNSTDIKLLSLYATPDNKLGTLAEDTQPLPPRMTIRIKRDPGDGTLVVVPSAHIAFAPPFAKSYLLASSLCNTSVNLPPKGAPITDPAASLGCTWWPSKKPTEEWEIKNPNSENSKVIITLSQGNASANIIIKSNGDTEIE